MEIILLECPKWAYPATRTLPIKYVVLFLAEQILEFRDSYNELVKSLVLNGAASFYFWGMDRDKADDFASFSIAEKEPVYAVRMGCSAFITTSFSQSLDECLEIIRDSYISDVFPNEKGVLIVAYLRDGIYAANALELLRKPV